MAKTIGVLCTLIVGLQILIGVPLAVCVACFCVTNGPITVEVHAGHGHMPQFVVHGATIPPPGAPFAVTPPPNTIPTTTPTSFDNPILQSRAEHGSPLAGTLLESTDPAEEQHTFVTALEKAAAEHADLPQPAVCPATGDCQSSDNASSIDPKRQAGEVIVRYLYEMAGIDEQAGEYERADQWRAFAREIRGANGGEMEGQIDRQAAAATYLLPVSAESPSTAD